MMDCKHCGFVLTNAVKFCNSCGKPQVVQIDPTFNVDTVLPGPAGIHTSNPVANFVTKSISFVIVTTIAVAIAGLIGISCILAVGGLFEYLSKPTTNKVYSSNTKVPEVVPLELVNGWAWQKPSDIFLELHNVKIKNTTNQDIKDPVISCSAFGESGTHIDSNSREQFKIIKAGETLNLGTVDMGFLHSQTARLSCTIKTYKKI